MSPLNRDSFAHFLDTIEKGICDLMHPDFDKSTRMLSTKTSPQKIEELFGAVLIGCQELHDGLKLIKTAYQQAVVGKEIRSLKDSADVRLIRLQLKVLRSQVLGIKLPIGGSSYFAHLCIDELSKIYKQMFSCDLYFESLPTLRNAGKMVEDVVKEINGRGKERTKLCLEDIHSSIFYETELAFENLERLEISNSYLTTIPPFVFRSPKLCFLQLGGGNNFTESTVTRQALEIITGLPKLRNFNPGCPIPDVIQAHLEKNRGIPDVIRAPREKKPTKGFERFTSILPTILE